MRGRGKREGGGAGGKIKAGGVRVDDGERGGANVDGRMQRRSRARGRGGGKARAR